MADDPNTPPGNGNPPPGNGNPPPGGGQDPFWAKLPDNMKGANAEETLQKLMPSWEGYHKTATERAAAAPKSADDFKFETKNEKLAAYFKGGDDPMMKAAKAVAFEMGLPAGKFSGAIEKVFGDMADKGMLLPPLDLVADTKAKAEIAGIKQLDDAGKAALQQTEKELDAFATNLGKQLKLGEREQDELSSLLLTPGGFGLLKALTGAFGADGMKVGGQGAAGDAVTQETLHALGADPRVDPMSPKYDKAFRADYDAKYQAFYAAKT